MFDIDRIRVQQQTGRIRRSELVTKNGALVLEGPEASKSKIVSRTTEKRIKRRL